MGEWVRGEGERMWGEGRWGSGWGEGKFVLVEGKLESGGGNVGKNMG